jgi:hypothetical protein
LRSGRNPFINVFGQKIHLAEICWNTVYLHQNEGG